MLKRFSLFLITLASLTVSFSSCSNDSDDDIVEPGTTSSLTFNDVKAGKMLNTVCEITSYPSSLGGGKELTLDATFIFGDEWMAFDLAVPTITSISQLEKGIELADDIVIYKYFPFNSAFIGHERYEVMSGNATVEKVSNSDVTVKFSNFTFLRELGSDEETFTVNGTISYTIND